MLTEVTTNAVGSRAPAVARQPHAGAWRGRHCSGSWWAEPVQEGARLSLSSTLSDSQICGLTLTVPTCRLRKSCHGRVPRASRPDASPGAGCALCLFPKGGLPTVFCVVCVCIHASWPCPQNSPVMLVGPYECMLLRSFVIGPSPLPDRSPWLDGSDGLRGSRSPAVTGSEGCDHLAISSTMRQGTLFL